MEIQIESTEKAYSGYAKVERWLVRQGDSHRTVECVKRGHSVAVLPYDKKLDAVLLVSQFRPGALDQGPTLVEMIAGMIDEGESAQAAAIREAHEETGLQISASKMCLQGRYYLSPGITNETTTIYLAEADLSAIDLDSAGGVEAEGEYIQKHLFNMSKLDELQQPHNSMSVTLALALTHLKCSLR